MRSTKILSWTILFIVIILIGGSMLSCSRKTLDHQTTEKIKKDTTATKESTFEKDSLLREIFGMRTEFERILEELETIQSGSMGKVDSSKTDVPFQTKILTAGDDSIILKGQWLSLEYRWKRAARKSTEKNTSDSTSANTVDYKRQLSEKDTFISSLQSELEIVKAEKTKGYSFWDMVVIALVGAAIGGLIVFFVPVLFRIFV